jgi:hypothetical protein
MNIIERIDLLLNESFDTGKKLKVIAHSNTPDWIEYEFDVEGNKYDFHASSDVELGSLWSVEFAKIDSYGYDERYGVTGTGRQMKVFAAVARCFDIFIKSKKPKVFYFTAENRSRQKLYDRFAKSITQKYPSYRLSNNANILDYIGEHDGDRVYVFERR